MTRKPRSIKKEVHVYALGDLVKTRSGMGNVIELLQDGKLLVQLHDQPFKVRENRVEVVFVGRPT